MKSFDLYALLCCLKPNLRDEICWQLYCCEWLPMYWPNVESAPDDSTYRNTLEAVQSHLNIEMFRSRGYALFSGSRSLVSYYHTENGGRIVLYPHKSRYNEIVESLDWDKLPYIPYHRNNACFYLNSVSGKLLISHFIFELLHLLKVTGSVDEHEAENPLFLLYDAFNNGVYDAFFKYIGEFHMEYDELISYLNSKKGESV